MALVGADEGVIGIKEKYTEVHGRPARRSCPTGVRILPLRDTYPAGDEFLLVYDAIGRVIPPGGLPKDVGAVVANVETLVNIGLDRPVTHKYLTVAGAVRTPVTLRVPDRHAHRRPDRRGRRRDRATRWPCCSAA